MARNKEKTKANNIVYKSLQKGTLIKKSCEVCGLKKTEGHHNDYTKPLEVTWLCRHHHEAMHPEFYTKKEKTHIPCPRDYPKYYLLLMAVMLRAEGRSYDHIAILLGVTGGAICKWLNPQCVQGYKERRLYRK